jgi:hypothetical protein
VLEKLQKIAVWQASIIIAVVGLVFYASGLSSPFWDDDFTQIVNNLPIHSLGNIKLFFESSTFYYGGGIKPLQGTYYRPLMTTVYSVIYSLSGANALAFHVVLFVLFLDSAILLYLVFCYSFQPIVALLLTLIFVVNPLNTQTVYAISSMGDVLFFFFGILALWLLLRFRSIRSLIPVSLCLLLCLLSKETGVVFVAMACVYLFWFNRERLSAFIGMQVMPIALYLYLKIKAVGFISYSNLAPIDKASLLQRLYTTPSIILFYMTHFIAPWRLATGYYWVDKNFSFEHVLLPLFADIALLALMVYVGYCVRAKLTKAQFYSYLFFGLWFWLGMLTCIQIIPIDLTACETWFLFSMAGLLGMIGFGIQAVRCNPYIMAGIACIFIFGYGIRTEIRGFDWHSSYTLARKDITASPDDYNAYTNLSNQQFLNGHYVLASHYDEQSIAAYPSYYAYYDLGVNLSHEGQYAAARTAYMNALKYNNVSIIYENLAALTLVTGSAAYDTSVFRAALSYYPDDAVLWLYLALDEQKYNEPAEAKEYMQKAATYGAISPAIYAEALHNKPVRINFLNTGRLLVIPSARS